MKTSELIGTALDWAVAKAAGLKVHVGFQVVFYVPHRKRSHYRWAPSDNWKQGGPIIERANVTIIRADDDYEVAAKGFTTTKRIPQWFAECSQWTGHSTTTSYEGENMEPTFMISEDGYYGTTPLIAAMRCFVASKLGEEVDIPQELLT
mgnify:CR=1 FL=1